MKIGVFGARADARGLAIQVSEFCRHMDPAKIFGVDMQELSPYPNDWARSYDMDKLQVVPLGEINERKVRRFLNGLDVVWGAETFYVEWLADMAREMGVKTALSCNFEFMPFLDPKRPRPDLFLAPSTWNVDRWPAPTIHLPFPVDRKRLPFVKRERVETFLHIGGHRAMRDRNGTRLVLAATRHVRTPCTVLVRSQSPVGSQLPHPQQRAVVEIDRRIVADYWTLYDRGDVLLAPRRYGGLSLPMNEALSRGMPVVSFDVPPQNEFLPKEGLIKAKASPMRVQPGTVEWYDGNARDLGQLMAELVATPGLVQRLSTAANAYADTISWDTLKPVYEEVFEALMRGNVPSTCDSVSKVPGLSASKHA